MRKFLLAFLMVVALAAGMSLAYAAVGVKGAGTIVGKTETLDITGPTVAASGTDITINTLTETGDKVITGGLTVTGTIVDSAVYTKSASTYPTQLVRVGADGTIYGKSTGPVIDLLLYSASAGTGSGKFLRISADGTIYASTN
jgi:hypothetical protein